MARHLRPGPELDKARREVAEYQRFRDLVGQVTEVNGRSATPARSRRPAPATRAPPGREGGKGAPEALAE